MANFYFQVTTAHDILRRNGVDVGKRDYLSNFGWRSLPLSMQAAMAAKQRLPTSEARLRATSICNNAALPLLTSPRKAGWQTGPSPRIWVDTMDGAKPTVSGN